MNPDFLLELSKLGISISAEVYQAGHTIVYQGLSQDSSPVAIKVLTALGDSSYAKAYSECEVQLRFSYHSRVVRVLHSLGLRCSGELLWSFVIVMEWLGQDFTKEIAARKTENAPWTEAELMQIARDLVDTLAELQENGVAHRDIKPANLFYAQGYAKIGDFGSSRTEDLMAHLRSISQLTVTGTPFYMSPELKFALIGDQAKVHYDPYKSDVYSLGMTLLCCYLLEPPIALLDMNTVAAKTHEILQSVSFLGLRQLLESMLQRDPEKRLDFLQLRAGLNVGLEPRCLHLPNEQRQGFSLPCHGFFCCFCVLKCIVTEVQSGVLQTYECPVCSQGYEYFQPNESSDSTKTLPLHAYKSSEQEPISAIRPPPSTDTSAVQLVVEDISISAEPRLPQEPEAREMQGNRPKDSSTCGKCLFALCTPGRKRKNTIES